MSEARPLSPLSETDYEAIAGAVMETARGRWFMAEFARRNRQADTLQLLGAIGRIEKIVGVGVPRSESDPNLTEAAALIGDLRLDLERISGRGGDTSSGLAARIETAAGTITAATESIQEAAWMLREAGADDAACTALDKRATEISRAASSIEGTAHQVGKIADTIAMLDSSLRAFCEAVQESETQVSRPQIRASILGYDMPAAQPLSSYDDLDIVEVSREPVSVLVPPRSVPPRPATDLKLQVHTIVHDDLDFQEPEGATSEAENAEDGPPLRGLQAATSEAELRALDAMPTDQKLAYFA